LPPPRALRAPTAGSPRGLAGEAGRLDQLLQLGDQRRLLRARHAGREPHVVKEPLVIVEPEQERADDVPLGRVPESAHNAVRGAPLLDLLHAGPVAGVVGKIPPLRDDAVQGTAGLLVPAYRRPRIVRCRRQSNARMLPEILRGERFEALPALLEPQLDERRSSLVDEK